MRKVLLVIFMVLILLTVGGCPGLEKSFVVQPMVNPYKIGYHEQNKTAEYYWLLGQYDDPYGYSNHRGK